LVVLLTFRFSSLNFATKETNDKLIEERRRYQSSSFYKPLWCFYCRAFV